MDIATEEFSHLEIVGATIQMLLGPVNGELKNAVEINPVAKLADGKQSSKEELIHNALSDPQFLVLSGGGPTVTDSRGPPWSGNYVNANGDLTVNLRSDIAAESRAKIVYEYLMKFTEIYWGSTGPGIFTFPDDQGDCALSDVFGSTRKHTAELSAWCPQGDPRFTHAYFNMSNGASVRGPWNQGRGPWPEGEWTYVEDPVATVRETRGLTDMPDTAPISEREVETLNQKLATQRHNEVSQAVPKGENQCLITPRLTSSAAEKQVESGRAAVNSKPPRALGSKGWWFRLKAVLSAPLSIWESQGLHTPRERRGGPKTLIRALQAQLKRDC